jgi:hypothetical protein
MKPEWNEAAWLAYYGHMRAHNAGKRWVKPRTPLQYGTHIDSLPRERNVALPQHRSLIDAEYHCHHCRDGAHEADQYE